MLRHDFKRIIYSYGFYIAVALFVVTGILQQLSYTDGKARMLQTFGVTNFGFLNRYIASTCGDISAVFAAGNLRDSLRELLFAGI